MRRAAGRSQVVCSGLEMTNQLSAGRNDGRECARKTVVVLSNRKIALSLTTAQKAVMHVAQRCDLGPSRFACRQASLGEEGGKKKRERELLRCTLYVQESTQEQLTRNRDGV